MAQTVFAWFKPEGKDRDVRVTNALGFMRPTGLRLSLLWGAGEAAD